MSDPAPTEQTPDRATERPPVERAVPATARLRALVPGLALALALGAVATVAGRAVPVIGGPVLGILLGVAAAATIPAVRSDALVPGLRWSSRFPLQAAIVVLGATLSLGQVARVGLESLPVLLTTLAVALAGAALVGRWLGVAHDARVLIGVGTGICGASAIAATAAVIEPRRSDVAYAIGTIVTFNVAAVLLFPPLGHLMDLDPHAFGLWAGTAINDTSSVVAAAYSYGGDAGPYALVVKLTRTLMIVPIVLFLAHRRRRAEFGTTPVGGGHVARATRLVPPFLVGFLVAAGLTSLGVVPASWHGALTTAGTFLITTALAAIGLTLRPDDVRRAGLRPLALGGILWVAVAVTSLIVQAATGLL